MLIVLDEFTLEEHLSRPLQTNKNYFKIANTFLSGFNGIFNVTNNINKFFFAVSIKDDNFNQITISQLAYKIESLNKEIKRFIIEKRIFIEAYYPITIKTTFSTLGSFTEISSNITGSHIAFTLDDNIRDVLGFKPKVKHED